MGTPLTIMTASLGVGDSPRPNTARDDSSVSSNGSVGSFLYDFMASAKEPENEDALPKINERKFGFTSPD
ncbi:hypothetical protein TNCV_2947121 [Trichonephila clavipes]|nr:hypothetical protein TNCV_2947121 [Trichonephila clavipes]